ncbi:MAG: TetR/AcrR family transcriptional regulator [Candidatus Latescibacterota bacterium]
MGKAKRRDQILEEAARLFSSQRFDEVLMDDIAQSAGVAKGTLYTYFSDKEELYFAVIFEGISRLNQQVLEKASSQKDPEKKLRDIVHSIVSFVAQNGFFYKLLSIEDSKSNTGKSVNRERWREERKIQLEAIESVLMAGHSEGSFRVCDSFVEAAILRDMVRSTVINASGKLSVDEMVDVIMRIFIDGIRRTSSPLVEDEVSKVPS